MSLESFVHKEHKKLPSYHPTLLLSVLDTGLPVFQGGGVIIAKLLAVQNP
jgi:hypothetical protein